MRHIAHDVIIIVFTDLFCMSTIKSLFFSFSEQISSLDLHRLQE